jgi:hypothetical protein
MTNQLEKIEPLAKRLEDAADKRMPPELAGTLFAVTLLFSATWQVRCAPMP